MSNYLSRPSVIGRAALLDSGLEFAAAPVLSRRTVKLSICGTFRFLRRLKFSPKQSKRVPITRIPPAHYSEVFWASHLANVMVWPFG